MQPALRNRLTYGPIMLAALIGILYVDASAQDWTSDWLRSKGYSHGIEGIGLLALLAFLLPFANYEVARLFTAEHVQPYSKIAALGSGALALHAFLTQFEWFQPIAASTLAFIIVFVMLAAALRRALMKQTQEAITHMA